MILALAATLLALALGAALPTLRTALLGTGGGRGGAGLLDDDELLLSDGSDP